MNNINTMTAHIAFLKVSVTIVINHQYNKMYLLSNKFCIFKNWLIRIKEFKGPGKNTPKYSIRTTCLKGYSNQLSVPASVMFSPNSHSPICMVQIKTWFIGKPNLFSIFHCSVLAQSLCIFESLRGFVLLGADSNSVWTGLQLPYPIQRNIQRTVRSEFFWDDP